MFMCKKYYLFFCLCFFLNAQKSTAQIEGQEFCEGLESGTYFPMNIGKKKILWDETYYIEQKRKTSKLGGKMYTAFSQTWESGTVNTIYLRKANDGKIWQYEECCNDDTLRYDPKLEEGDTWKSVDGKSKYEVISLNAKLSSPFCEYNALMRIRAVLATQTFDFYYQRGYGYVGATYEGQIMSAVTPE